MIINRKQYMKELVAKRWNGKVKIVTGCSCSMGLTLRKIVIVDGNSKPWTDESGIMYVGVIPFLLEEINMNS